jgi:hypothetical protein
MYVNETTQVQMKATPFHFKTCTLAICNSWSYTKKTPNKTLTKGQNKNNHPIKNIQPKKAKKKKKLKTVLFEVKRLLICKP